MLWHSAAGCFPGLLDGLPLRCDDPQAMSRYIVKCVTALLVVKDFKLMDQLCINCYMTVAFCMQNYTNRNGIA
jgi:hypothetical protein